jgi:AraC-like DNA-binding protein
MTRSKRWLLLVLVIQLLLGSSATRDGKRKVSSRPDEPAALSRVAGNSESDDHDLRAAREASIRSENERLGRLQGAGTSSDTQPNERLVTCSPSLSAQSSHMESFSLDQFVLPSLDELEAELCFSDDEAMERIEEEGEEGEEGGEAEDHCVGADELYWEWFSNYEPSEEHPNQRWTVDEPALAALCFEGVMSDQELANEFNVPVSLIWRLKRKLKLTWLGRGGEHPSYPDLAQLDQLWNAEPTLTVAELSVRLGCSPRALRYHFNRVGFICPFHGGQQQPVDDETVISALAEISERGYCSKLGHTFADSDLRVHFGIYASKKQIKRCLRLADPDNVRQRARKAAAMRYVYSVGGPRSLYHCDAHEKLAKLWGIWIHVCIDGYSRYIIYLKVTTDKASETVRQIFVEGCNEHGWASRCRWDKGTENVGAAAEQIFRMGTGRGSALTGRSSLNCRAEYIWAFVKVHISSYFRDLFFRMERDGLFSREDPGDLHCLQAVYVTLVQEACDHFRVMWNEHRIREPRSHSTLNFVGRRVHSGIPSEMFMEPIASQSVLEDELYNRNPETYGSDGPSGEDTSNDLPFNSHEDVIDPLVNFPFLQYVRSAYFVKCPLLPDNEGMDAFLLYRTVCDVLRHAALEFGDKSDDAIDWDAFVESSLDLGADLILLHEQLAWLALNH